MTAGEFARGGVADVERVAAAYDEVASWCDAVPAAEVLEGLRRAGDPAGALHALATLLELARPPAVPGQVAPLLRALGGSVALARSLAAEGASWPALADAIAQDVQRDVAAHRALLSARGAVGLLTRPALQQALRRHCRRELVRIGARDLTERETVDDTIRELSALAEGVIDVALACVRARVAAEWGGDADAELVVFGMGKLGGSELNYSSDIDLVFVYDHDGEHVGGRTICEFFVRVAEETRRALAEVTEDGMCFRVDLRLRPGGTEGPLAISITNALSYYETWGQTWERAVWVKARPVGGARAIGDAFTAEMEPFVYRRFLDFATLEDLKDMKEKVDASLRGPSERERNVKLGRGGIREVEFFVQAHQLIHAGKDARLRGRSTLPVLERLVATGVATTVQTEGLAEAYRFLRDVEHKLQVVHQRQTHMLPDDPAEFSALARRLGFVGDDVAHDLRATLGRHTGLVHRAFEGLFRGSAEARREAESPAVRALMEELDIEERALWRLGELGFRDCEAAYRDMRLLRDGPPHAPSSPKRRQAMRALAPALLTELARCAAPDRALHHVATFIATIGARTSYLHLLLENGSILRLLVRLFATSEFLSQYFLRHPELLDSLVRADLVRITSTPAEMQAEIASRLVAADDLEMRLDVLRRFRHEEFLRIGVHDIEGDLDPAGIEGQLTAVAETCVDAAMDVARHEVMRRAPVSPDALSRQLVVVGMGKVGAGELNYHSDLDVLFVYEAGEDGVWTGAMGAHEFFTRVAQRTLSALQTTTREGIVYKVDTRLRPEGDKGPLVTSLDAFVGYHRASAALWERQAMVKARVIAGPAALQARVDATIERLVYARGLEPDEVQEIALMRDRIERERGGGRSMLNIKTGAGGIVDVEWVVQMLQLRHGHAIAAVRVRATRAALAALEAAGVLPAEDAAALREGYAFLRAVERRLRIEYDQPVERLDDDPATWATLARRLGHTGSDAEVAGALQAEHDRHRAAVRAAYSRAFAVS